MNPQQTIQYKEFSFKGTSISTMINRDSKMVPTIRSNEIEELFFKKNESDNSADISSGGQSLGEASAIENEGKYDQNNKLTLSQYRSDNESINLPKNKKSIINTQQIHEANLSLSNNLIYKTDSELFEPISMLRTTFLPEKNEKHSITAQIFEISGDLVGIWIYVVPMAFSYGGLYLSIAAFFIIDLIIYYSEMLMISCAVLSKRNNLKEITENTYGEAFYYISGICICFFHFCQISTSLIIMGKTMAHFFSLITDAGASDFVWADVDKNKVWVPIFMVFIIFPLWFFKKNLAFLCYARRFNLIVVLFILILMIVQIFFQDIPVSNEFTEAKGFDSTGFLTMFPMTCFFFTQADLALRYYQNLQIPNLKKTYRGMKPSRIINVFIVVTFGIFGYVSWSTEKNFSEKYSVVLLAPYPNNIAWTFAYILAIISMILVISNDMQELEMNGWITKKLWGKIFAVGLMILAACFSIFIGRIQEIMVWAGCLICSPVNFIFNFLFIFICF